MLQRGLQPLPEHSTCIVIHLKAATEHRSRRLARPPAKSMGEQRCVSSSVPTAEGRIRRARRTAMHRCRGAGLEGTPPTGAPLSSSCTTALSVDMIAITECRPGIAPSPGNLQCELYRRALVSFCKPPVFISQAQTVLVQMARGWCHGGSRAHSSCPSSLHGVAKFAAAVLAVVALTHIGLTNAQGLQASPAPPAC